MVTRREALLRLGLMASAPLLAPASFRALAEDAVATGDSPFQKRLPRIPELKPTRSDRDADYYLLTARLEQASIVPGLATSVWGFNGQFPGPTLRTKSGRRTIVRQINHLPEPIAVHLHGGHVPANMDGHPTDLILPGHYRDYVYPNRQAAATLWYHDHAMDVTGPHVYRGLAGFYLIEDEFEQRLRLPRGKHDVPIVIQDRLFNPDGSFDYTLTDMVRIEGLLGDRVLANGAIQPYFPVQRRAYRLRFLNASNARAYVLALSDGHSMWQIAGDGGLLPAAVERSNMLISPGERLEVLVDFSYYPVGAQIILKNQIGTGSTEDILRFDVIGRDIGADDEDENDDEAFGRAWTPPRVLRPIPRLAPAHATATRRFVFAHGPTIKDPWTIDGKAYDPTRIDARIALGAVEIWELVSESRMPHPIHLHDIAFQILDRNGVPPPSYELGWKDTVTLFPGEVVRIIARFDDYQGVYVFHCHMLEHEDFAMMGQFEVV